MTAKKRRGWNYEGERATIQDGADDEGYLMAGRSFINGVQRELKHAPHSLTALQVLWGLLYFVQWNTCECRFGRQEDLAEYLGMKPQNVSKGLKVLEDIGAIKRVKEGTTKKVLLTPEGVYRGSLSDRPKVVEEYRNVVPFPARSA